MARKVQVQLTDDLDEGAAAETVVFGLDGHLYEIDLNEANAASLRASLSLYTNSARKARAGKRRRRTAPTAAPAAPALTPLDLSPAAVRAWAEANDVSVSSRGRIPATVLELYTTTASK